MSLYIWLFKMIPGREREGEREGERGEGGREGERGREGGRWREGGEGGTSHPKEIIL